MLGEALMDAEHRGLVTAMRTLLNVPEAEADAAIHDFVRQWRDHCADEEALMHARGYPCLEAHRESHRTFDGLLLYHLSEYLNAGMWGSREMASFVLRWFMGHLREFDRPLADYLREAGGDDS